MGKQSNIQQGIRVYNSGEALTNKELYLAKVVDGGSIPELLLPTAITDLALVIIDDAGAEDEETAVIPLVTGELRRMLAKGAGSAGAVLTLADPATPADKGKVRSIPATAGAHFSPGIAEEDFADGQHVLVRVWPRLVTVAAAFTGDTPADTAATNVSPYGYAQAQADALVDNVREMRTALIAAGIMASN